MTDKTPSGRPTQPGSRLYDRMMSRGGQFLVVSASLILMLGGLIVGFAVGRYIAYRDLPAAQQLIRQLQTAGQRLKTQLNDEAVKLTAQEDKLADVQAQLQAIMPSKDTYNIPPNEAVMVAGGHLTIGMIGSPSNESVNININGKAQRMATGDMVNISPDASTNCQVRLQSFDVFKAIVYATCTPSQPH